MANDTTKSPFEKLGTTKIDTFLTRSTKQENKETSFLVKKETGKQVSQETRKRADYPKFTYQMNPLVTEKLEDTKRILKRQYNIKATLAEIVEEAIQNACQDVQENKETSFLVNMLSRKQETK